MVYGVILAGGSGKRMKINQKKQYISLNNKPVVIYSLEKFLKIKEIDKIVLVINEDDKNNKIVNEIITKYNKLIHTLKLNIILGGKERYDSVYNAINFIEGYYNIKNNDKIIIHDSARPNVDLIDIKKLIKSLSKYKSISLGYRLSDSIKEIKPSNKNLNIVKNSCNRNNYLIVTTPQGFNLQLLKKCYDKFYDKPKSDITDDLQIIEYYSKEKSYILDSNKFNIKITTKDDLNMLKYII